MTGSYPVLSSRTTTVPETPWNKTEGNPVLRCPQGHPGVVLILLMKPVVSGVKGYTSLPVGTRSVDWRSTPWVDQKIRGASVERFEI